MLLEIAIGILAVPTLAIIFMAMLVNSGSPPRQFSSNPDHPDHGFWILPNTFFAQATDETFVWRMHTCGSLTKYRPDMVDGIYKYETMQNRAIYNEYPRDSVFFSLGNELYLGNSGANRFERFSKDAGVWCVIDQHWFKEKLKEYRNEQRLEISK